MDQFMKSKKYIAFGFISALGALALGFSTTLLAKEAPADAPTTEASRLQSLAKFTKVLSIVEKYNVDKLSIEELMDKALAGMMAI